MPGLALGGGGGMLLGTLPPLVGGGGMGRSGGGVLSGRSLLGGTLAWGVLGRGGRAVGVLLFWCVLWSLLSELFFFLFDEQATNVTTPTSNSNANKIMPDFFIVYLFFW